MLRGLALVALLAVAGFAALAVSGFVDRAGPPVSSAAPETISYDEDAEESEPLDCELRERRFRTLRDAQPAAYCVALRPGVEPSGEGILVTPRPDPRVDAGEQFGLMLFSGSGKLLWYQPRPAKVHDLKEVTYRGERMLAFFEREEVGGFHQLLDEAYRPVAEIRAAGGLMTDEHDLQLTPRGTAYLASDERVEVPGPGSIVDYIVQEVDVESGEALFEWRASRRVPFRDSYMARPLEDEPWDYFHGNSIEPPSKDDPTVIVSARNTSAVYGIDRRTGRTSWILGGKADQFGVADDPRTRFCTQHDARRLDDGSLMLFDNGGSAIRGVPRCRVHPARALQLRLDVERRQASVVRSVSSAPIAQRRAGFRSGWVGSARPQRNGDWLIAWGSIPRVDAIAPDGTNDLLLRMRYWSYRAVPSRWVGRPGGSPAIVAERDGDETRVWASWNGATEIRRWQVLAGPAPRALRAFGRPVPFEDLETEITARTDAPYVAVRALDASGATLGQSAAVRAR